MKSPAALLWVVGGLWCCLGVSGPTATPPGGTAGDGDAPPLVAALLRDVARPIDRVQLKDGETVEIEPYGPDKLLDRQFAGPITTNGIAKEEQFVLTPEGVAGYVPYEKWTLDRLAKFHKEAGELPAIMRLAAAEKVLGALLAFHLSARDRPLQGVNLWADLHKEIERDLLATRRQLLRGYALAAHDGDGWQKALRFGELVAQAYRKDAGALTEIAHLKTGYARFLLLQSSTSKDAAVHYKAIRQQLDWLDDNLPRPPAAEMLGLLGDVLSQAGSPCQIVYDPSAAAIRDFLERKAALLVAAAHAAKDDKQALRFLEAAEQIWPRWPGLHDEVLRRTGKYTILYVGVRRLPEFLSPARAVTDVERQAVELLFESLVQLRPAGDGRLAYEPQLASSAPTLVGFERQFVLRHGASFASGQRVTAADVQKTFELLTARRAPGRSAELADNVEPVRSAGDAFQVAFKYNKGLLDPLAPLAFKVLPGDLQDAADEKFARAPLGSGPFKVAGTMAEHGRTYLRFVANPYYRPGPGKQVPQIREVRLFESHDPAADFANKTAPMHLLLDARTQDLGQAKKAGARLAATVAERRVWFLALNHREPLLADQKLRRALAHGIDRERILADHFGGGVAAFRAGPLAQWGATGPVVAAAMAPGASSHHHALNGPFPAGSWAVCPDDRVPARLGNRAMAETFLRGAVAASVELELKYPSDDPRIEAACRSMAEQLAEIGAKVAKPVTLKLVGLAPQQLQRDVLAGKYQLAYWHHDYPTDLYSLAPLFDARDEAIESGANFLGYKNDGSLEELLQKAGSYRDFAQVKRLTHDIHVTLFEKMPLVPLWQLEYHIALHPALTVPQLDPRGVFGTIDEWRVQ